MKKEKTDKIIKYGLLIEFAFILILVINIYAYIVSNSNFAKTAIIIEIAIIIIAKNILKSRIIKKILEHK